MVKYVKSSERSERLAGIQRNREQIKNDNATAMLTKLKNELNQFASKYGSRVADLYDTWVQLNNMGEISNYIKTPYGESSLTNRKGWIFAAPAGYINTEGQLGYSYSVPYSSTVGTYESHIVLPGEDTSRFFSCIQTAERAEQIFPLIPKAAKAIEYLEDYIYGIADRIEE